MDDSDIDDVVSEDDGIEVAEDDLDEDDVKGEEEDDDYDDENGLLVIQWYVHT